MSSRLHPASVLYRAGSSAARLAWLLVIFGLGSTSVGLGPAAAALVVGAGLALALAWQIAYYRRFRYELTDDTFDIRSGVLSRRTREIPLGRIQNVDIERNVLQRALGVAEVRLETAGGSGTEAHLRYVSHEEARRLQRELGRRARGRRSGTADAADEPEAERLFAVTPRELALLGLVSVDLRLLSLVSVALPLLAPSLVAGPGWEDPLVALAATAPALAAAVVLVAAAVSAARAVGNYYGFELWRADDELRYDRGLFRRYSGTIPLEKVQTVTVEENALARRLGYASLTVETAGYGPGDSGAAQSAVPLAERDRVFALARSVEPFEEISFERPPARARRRYLVRYALVVFGLTALSYGVVTLFDLAVPWYLPLAGLALVPLAAHLKWINLGYALLDEHVVTRAGFFTRTTKVVPYYRVQTVATSRTVFQRRRDLATLLVDTAGARSLTGDHARAIDLDAATAEALRETVADRLQRSLAGGRSGPRRTRPPASSGRPTGDPSDATPG